MQGQRTDAHEHTALAVLPQGLLDGGGHLLQILVGGALRHLVDQRHVRLTHADDEVILPVGEEILHHLQRDALAAALHRSDDEYAAGYLGGHVQLLGPHIDVADKDVVGDDVLDEGALVVLFLIVRLGGVQGHAGHGAHGAAHAVIAGGEHGIVKMSAPAGQRLEGLALQRNAAALGGVDGLHILGPLLADTRQLAASDDGTLGVNDAHGAIGGILEL